MVDSWNNLMHSHKSGLIVNPPAPYEHRIWTDAQGRTTLCVHDVDGLHRAVQQGIQDFEEQSYNAVPQARPGRRAQLTSAMPRQ
eukprot:10717611-Prorocentrum_lima.AAC.1